MSAAVCSSRLSTRARSDMELFFSCSALVMLMLEKFSHSSGVTVLLEETPKVRVLLYILFKKAGMRDRGGRNTFSHPRKSFLPWYCDPCFLGSVVQARGVVAEDGAVVVNLLSLELVYQVLLEVVLRRAVQSGNQKNTHLLMGLL